MRSVAVLLLVLVTAWPQLATGLCTMGAPADQEEAPHHGGHQGSGEDRSSERSGEPGCGLMMACGSAASAPLTAAVPALLERDGLGGFARPAGGAKAPILPSDPPPPRLPV